MTKLPTDVYANPPVNDDFPVLRDRTIRQDNDGLICLNDIWQAAGSDKNRRPSEWCRTSSCKRLKAALALRIAGYSHISPSDLIASNGRGAKALTFVHIVLAQAYAEFLDDDLAVEVREVFLRYRTGDTALADDILERASAEENRRVATRAMGRATRGQFTDVLKDHGVVAPYYAICTDTMYRTVLGKPASQLKQAMGVPKRGSLRDAMSLTSLAAVALAEAFSSDRIDIQDCHGGEECKQATAAAARSVRAALDAEARSRSQAFKPPANDDGSANAA